MEVFSGTSRLTAAIKQLGLRDSFGIDHAISNRLVAPVVQLDLTQSENFEFLQDIICEPGCIYVHFAPPCGTASRARFLKRRGRYNPPILRTDDCPDGLPSLTALHAAKVAQANKLYECTQSLCRLCIEEGIPFSIENPARSFMWQTCHMAKFLQDHDLFHTRFHHCMYGSARRKHTLLVHNISAICDMECLCDNSHAHEPWGQSEHGWATAEETAYPWPLCRKIATLVALHIQSLGVTCPTPSFAKYASQLDGIRQQTLSQPSAKGLPWVSEFKHIVQLHGAASVPPHARLLSTPTVGYVASASNKTVGVFRTPDEFIATALEAGHPGSHADQLPRPMLDAVKFCASHEDKYVATSRSETLRKLIARAKQLDPQEKSLKDNMSERRRQILKSKRLILFKELLQEAGSQDVWLADDVGTGFDLIGRLPESRTFEAKFRPASISTEALRNVADRARKAFFQSVKSSGDSGIDAGVFEATLKERDKGFLKGPIPFDAVPSGSTLTRRFGVSQKGKVRPIDDYKASLVNSAVTQVEMVTLHGVDHIAGLGSAFFKAFAASGRSEVLVAKCWDLAAAYKQIPLSDSAHLLDSYIVVFNPTSGRPEIFQQAVLPFGSVASVTAFLRCALGIWLIGSHALHLVWSSYFDDFLSFATQNLTKHTDLCISTFFHLLGWELSLDKLVPYSQCCKVLGVELVLYKSPEGMFTVCNTAERAEELTSAISDILRQGTLKKSDGEKLRGRLQFASNQLFGRRFRNCLRALNVHISRSNLTLTVVGPELKSALKVMMHLLTANSPRQVDANFFDWVHIYVDASFEPEGFSGVGGVLFNKEGVSMGCFSEQVDGSLLTAIMTEDQETAILELEGMAIAAALHTFGDVIKGHKVVVFTDNESVQACVVKCKSRNLNLDLNIRHICSSEESLTTMCWIERVPSYSNPADKLSRELVESFHGKPRTKVDLSVIWKACEDLQSIPSLLSGGGREASE